MFEKKRNLDTQRRGADFDQLGTAGKIGVDDLAALAHEAGEEGTRKGVGRGKGRRKRERERDVDLEQRDDPGGGGDAASGGGGGGGGGDGLTERGSKKARSEA
jgi:hypothetical protein